MHFISSHCFSEYYFVTCMLNQKITVMRNLLYCLLSIILLGCTNQAHKPLTDDVKNDINKEINNYLEIVAEGFKTMNFDKQMTNILVKSMLSEKILQKDKSNQCFLFKLFIW